MKDLLRVPFSFVSGWEVIPLLLGIVLFFFASALQWVAILLIIYAIVAYIINHSLWQQIKKDTGLSWIQNVDLTMLERLSLKQLSDEAIIMQKLSPELQQKVQQAREARHSLHVLFKALPIKRRATFRPYLEKADSAIDIVMRAAMYSVLMKEVRTESSEPEKIVTETTLKLQEMVSKFAVATTAVDMNYLNDDVEQLDRFAKQLNYYIEAAKDTNLS